MSLQLDKYLQELELLVNMDSGSRYPAGVRKVAEFFAEKFTKLGWQVQWLDLGKEVGPALKIVNRPADKYDLLVLGHMDTVFPEGTVAERPFKIVGERAYGPGVIDMKSGLLYAYYLAEQLQTEQLLETANICLLFNSDEEISSIYSRAVIEETAKNAAHAIVLEPARASGANVYLRKGVGRYKLTFKGLAAHAGVNPQEGASAIHEFAHWCTSLVQLNNPETETTLNVGMITGGSAANVVADYAQAQIDIRIKYYREAEKIQAQLAKLQAQPLDNRVQVVVEGGLTRPPMENTPGNQKLGAIADEVAASLGMKIDWVATGGGSDGSFTSALGVPTLDTFGPVGGLGHGVGEYIDIPSIEPRFELLMGIVKKILVKD